MAFILIVATLFLGAFLIARSTREGPYWWSFVAPLLAVILGLAGLGLIIFGVGTTLNYWR